MAEIGPDVDRTEWRMKLDGFVPASALVAIASGRSLFTGERIAPWMRPRAS